MKQLVGISLLLVACSTIKAKERNFWLSDFDRWVPQSANLSHSIKTDTHIVRHRAKSLRFEVRPQEGWTVDGTKTFRAEMFIPKNIAIGSERFYGFSLYLPADFPVEDNRLVLAQWWAPTKLHLGEKHRSPTMALRYRNGRLSVSIKYSSERIVKDPDNVPSKEIFSTGDFRLGAWNDFVFEAKWSYKDDGFINVWWNGKQVANYKGPVGYNDDQGPFFKFGIYRDDSERTYISYISEYRQGSSYSEVDPAVGD